MRDAVISELTSLNASVFVSKWILERVPHVFSDNYSLFIEWRGLLGQNIGVDPCAIVLTGSSSVGISLNPNKGFKLFDDRSDIDVAIISSYHFEVAWRYLRTLGSGYHRMNPAAKRAVDEHRMNYVYHGTIATDKLLAYLPFGKEWLFGLNEMAAYQPTEDRDIKARVYRDFDSLRGYQVSNVRKLSSEVISRRTKREPE